MQRLYAGSEVVRVPVNERLNEKQIKALVRYRERILSEGILTLIAEVEASEGLRLDYSLLCDDYVQLKTDVEVLRAENEALRKARKVLRDELHEHQYCWADETSISVPYRCSSCQTPDLNPHTGDCSWFKAITHPPVYEIADPADATHSQVIGGREG